MKLKKDRGDKNTLTYNALNIPIYITFSGSFEGDVNDLEEF